MSARARLADSCQRIAAALRAVADDPDLPVVFDARQPGLDARGAHLPALRGLPDGDAWLEWRVLGDRVAALHRFPPPLRNTPPDEWRRALFDALWQARAEILTGRALPGVAHSFERWLALHWDDGTDQLEGLPVSERLRLAIHHLAEPARLPPRLRAALARWLGAAGIRLNHLIDNLEDPRAYAAAALRLARALAPREPRVEREMPPRRIPTRRVPVPADSPRGRARRHRPVRSTPASMSGSAPVAATGSERYRVYSAAHDETLRPGDLVSAHELNMLRRRLEGAAPETTRAVARLARRLERRLQVNRPRRWREADTGGTLDPRRLSRLVTDPAASGVYRERAPAPARDTVVTLLIDNSASMRGRRIVMAALCADLLARSLERCGVRTEILGYTTVSWDGGPVAAAWRADGRPAHPGRLNARRHIVYKGADQPWRRARSGLGLMLREELLRENLDGEAVLWAAHRLARRPERRRILIVIGDGAPRDRATAAANGEGYLAHHLEAAIAEVERDGNVELLGVGIGQSVGRLYRRGITVRRIDELAPALTDELAGLLGTRIGRATMPAGG